MSRVSRKRGARSQAAEVLGPTPERMAKGSFRLVDVELESHQDRRAKVHRDFSATPIDEWLARGIITEQQHKACEYYAELYQAAGLLQRVTASYEGRTGGGSGMFGPGNTLAQCEAISELRKWGKKIPAKYLGVFTDVVVFGRRTGEAGADLGYVNKKAEASAMTCVRFVADLIAMEKRF